MRSPTKHIEHLFISGTTPILPDDLELIPSGSWCRLAGEYKSGSLHGKRTVPDAVNDNLPRIYYSVTVEKSAGGSQIQELKAEIAELRSRLDKIDSIIAREQTIDDEIVEEIEAIGAEPINELDIKPEDWLPTGGEIDQLLDD